MEIEEDGIKSDVLNSRVVVTSITATSISTVSSGEAVGFETVDQELAAGSGDNQQRRSSQQQHRGSAKSHHHHQISGKRPVGFYSSHPYNAQCTSPTKMLGGGGRNHRRRSLPTTPMSASLPSLGPKSVVTAVAEAAGEDWNPQQVKANRRLRRHQNKMGKRLRRLVQMAPNNNNEFLMQEHDHLYHLDDDDSNSDEQNGGDPGQRRVRTHRYSSSPEEDEEDYLARDFSNCYDVVHAERLFNMSKNQLIQEYQLMEERVELLENKLRTALLEKQRPEGEEDTEMTPVQESRNTSPKSDSIPVPNPSPRYFDDDDDNDRHRNAHQDSGLSGSLSDSDILIGSSTGSSCSSNACTSASSQLSSRRSSAQDRNYDDDDDEEEVE